MYPWERGVCTITEGGPGIPRGGRKGGQESGFQGRSQSGADRAKNEQDREEDTGKVAKKEGNTRRAAKDRHRETIGKGK